MTGRRLKTAIITDQWRAGLMADVGNTSVEDPVFFIGGGRSLIDMAVTFIPWGLFNDILEIARRKIGKIIKNLIVLIK